jgi:single-stranded-DNA-specific exonuclease
METARVQMAECARDDLERLERELGVRPVTAQVLVRRGLSEPAAAQAFLDGEARHDPRAFAGMDRAVQLILAHARAGSRITVHGDYDVDGVCATAILLRALARLGAPADWYLPDRAADGYGLGAATVERLAARSTRLLIAVDCGITATTEVAAARAHGMDVIIADHHEPPVGALPEALVVHPRLGGYPCPDLCAAAVAHKLAQALHDAAPGPVADAASAVAGAQAGPPGGVEEDLDLVALATIADSVPLLGENRFLARAGLRALARTRKPGLRALMARAGVEPGRLDERSVAFALAPRLNAAGRLYRADAALELVMAREPHRAEQIAQELERANSERKDAQTRVLFEAEAQVAALPERAAYVLAGEAWHPGVIGIVASRLAERHHRPFVLVALEGDLGKGSGRSIEAFDLVAALSACKRHLRRHGGHRAAAGLELERSELQRFGAAFAAHARQALTPSDLLPRVGVDALATGEDLSLELAEELRSLAPFGHGNPHVSLLVRDARLAEVRTMGEGRHLRFTVHADGASMNAVAFGFGRSPLRRELGEGRVCDGVFRLEVNEWRGAIEPRLGLVHVARLHAPAEAPVVLAAAASTGGQSGFAEGVSYPVRDARRDHTLAG